ncbi:MAG: restriction endonuclease subunit S [Candidatus Micrarchaeia archaeon]
MSNEKLHIGHKQTPIGKIPKEWEIRRFATICEFRRGFSYRSDQLSSNMTQFRFITINDVEKEGGLKRIAKKIYLSKDEQVSSEFFVENGDVLIANTDMAKGFIIGAPILIKNMAEKCVYSMDLTKLIFDKSKIDSEFLFYCLTYNPIRQKMKASAQGTNVLHLNHGVVGNFSISLPPLLEQQKIAEILSTVDDAIQKVDEIIEKTERLKKGLMQELLTKGIGHKEFKDTEIGRIPKDWEVVKVGNILSLEYGKGLPERERISGDYPVVGSNGIVGYHNKALVKGPGIVVGRKGTIGAVSWIDQDFWPIDTTYYVKPKISNIFLRWLFYKLTYLNPAKFHLADVVPGLKRELVHSLKMSLPSLSEQQKIVEMLSSVDEKLELERKRKEKLERIKKGLMNDLLTGRKRVKVI